MNSSALVDWSHIAPRYRRAWVSGMLALTVAAVTVGCSDGSKPFGGGNGMDAGASPRDGSPDGQADATSASGGAIGSGGAFASGGATGTGGGGPPGTGGDAPPATGGRLGTGGGLPGTGGRSGSGGSTGSGGLSTGTGGRPGGGGMLGTGGRLGTGGVISTGGRLGTGGVIGTGGTPGTGGIAATGGAPGTGGSVGCNVPPRSGCCTSDAGCKLGECVGGSCSADSPGVCKPKPTVAGTCWRTADCAPGDICSGVRVCQCASLCLLADMIGTCLSVR